MTEPDPISTWERLIRFHRVTITEMDRHLRAATGHSLDDYDVLHQLRRQTNPLRMGELAEMLVVANSSCHRIVGRLVDAGFVERSHGEDDGRVVLVSITAAGKKLYRRMAALHTRDINDRFVAPLGSSELGAIDIALRRLEHHASSDG